VTHDRRRAKKTMSIEQKTRGKNYRPSCRGREKTPRESRQTSLLQDARRELRRAPRKKEKGGYPIIAGTEIEEEKKTAI